MTRTRRLWIKLKRSNAFFSYFIYADTCDSRANRLFRERRIAARCNGCYKNDNEPYELFVVSVPTWQVNKFKDAIRDHAKNMILLGYPRYDEWCNRTFKIMKEVFEDEGKECITGDNHLL